MVDGIYTGQTIQVFSFDVGVNDSDGVDSVIFRFFYLGEWLNRTPTLVEGDEFDGIYEGRLVCSVRWDWANGRPDPSGHSFLFKVFANDTLGNWRETPEFSHSYGYYLIIPPFPIWLIATPLGWVLLGLSVIIVAVVIHRRWKRKQSPLDEETASGDLS